MLRGRESLMRLIGKRRRFLPNRDSLLSIPLQAEQISAVAVQEKSSQNQIDGEDEMSTKQRVICPVCGNTLAGDDKTINSHLDSCLLSGKKRKLTQRTLLELNFCSQTSSTAQKVFINSKDLGTVEEYESNSCEASSAGVASSTGKPLDKINNQVEGDLISSQVDLPALPLKDEVLRCDAITAIGDLAGVFLETSIVGRRFSVEKDLNLGAKISLLRDPNNVRDPNAIKVLLADSTHCKVLGFVPRELAQHLSPLIEKYCLRFEGHVISLPRLPLDPVPIQIACCEEMSHCSTDYNQTEALTFLWKNVLHVVESGKHHASRTTYLQNFWLLLQEVLRSNPHLFTNDEKNFMESFRSLSDDSQKLFVRLYTRKGPWFRMSTISYQEVLDLKQAVKDLSETGYINSFEDAKELQNNDLEDVLNLLTVLELREIASTFKNKKNGICNARKQDLITFLLYIYRNGLLHNSFLASSIFHRTGTCIKISSEADSLIWRAERLFFLNGAQDLSAFLLVDLGVVKFPTYRCIILEHVFSTRNDLIAFEEAVEVAQIMDESLEKNNNDLVLFCTKIANSRLSISSNAKATESKAFESATVFKYFSTSWVYSKVILVGISFLERERRYEEAINLLKQLLDGFPCDGRRGYWTLRLSIDLEHMGCSNESLSVAEGGLSDSWIRAGSKVALQKRVLRLGKPPRRWKAPSFKDSITRKIMEVHIQGRPLNCEIGKKNRFYGEDGEQCGVEQLALQYYSGEGGGWCGVHSESGIWLTIFGLLMWDVIFSDVPNVFHNRFQNAPLDLEMDGFYLARESLIESHLKRIHDGMGEEIVIMSWELHSGTSCRGVNWDRHSLSELRAAVSCIGGPCLASLCRYLALDYRSWSSGMPDLLLWRFHEAYRGEAKLVEVKGPKDRLSEQQHACILLLMDCGFSTEVCKVIPMPLDSS
ncbi:hypothetical protein M5689_009254 [Euphorbia peplus]|nr:hypothetical protein M5689_009254 [Euphorbia peplus]